MFRYGNLLVVLAAIALVGCSGEEKKDAPPAAAEIVSFAADAGSVEAGDEVTLSWETKHATSIELTANGAALEAEGKSGSLRLVLRETTHFVLVAQGAGEAATASFVVRAEAIQPRVLAFTATPDVVDEGEQVLLAWETEGADSVAIGTDEGEFLDLGGADPAGGTVTVRPMGSTTYYLRASRRDVTTVRSVDVTMKGAPETRLFVSPHEVEWGDAVSITWEADDAESIRLYRGDVLLAESEDGAGTFEDVPPLSATYRILATRAGKEGISSRQVSVRPKVLAFTAMTQEPTPTGEPVLLHYEVGGAESLTVSNRVDDVLTIEVEPEASGTVEIPQGMGSFRLEARTAGLSVVAETDAPLLHAPAITSFGADVEVLSGEEGRPALALLRWAGVEGAVAVALEGDTTGPVDIADEPLEAGEAEVEVTEDTVFSLRATNAAGDTTALASVRVVPYPTIESLALSPPYMAPMESFILAWEATGHAVAIFEDEALVHESEDLVGQLELSREDSTAFTLRVANEAGAEVEESVALNVGPLQNLHLDAAPLYVAPGDLVAVGWENLGGRSIRITTDDDALLCETTDLEEIAEGQCSFSLPTEGRHTVHYLLENDSDALQATLEVEVHAGPKIIAFEATPDAVGAGEAVTFSWEVENDPRGEPPVLSLVDQDGPYSLDGESPNAGSKSFTITAQSDRLLTLTATTSLGSKTATAALEVHEPISLSLSATPPLGDQENPVELSWTSENADGGLRLYALDEAGEPVNPPLYEIPEAERAAGSFLVEPQEPTTYRLVATGARGLERFDELQVGILPPEILSLSVAPDELIEMDAYTVTWTTKRATEVDLGPSHPMVPTEVQEPFIDISSTGTRLVFVGGTPYDTDHGDIAFPPSFRFPFGGVERDAIRVMRNGHAGFSFHAVEHPTSVNQALPDWRRWHYGSNAHLIPFWEYLFNPYGGIYYEFGADDRGERLIVQWHDMRNLPSVLNASFNFQIILWEDGAFDFRYGAMTADHADFQDAGSATIGYQNPTGGHYFELHHGTGGTPIAGGLSNRSWAFRRAPLPPDGSVTLVGGAADQVVLTAKGPGGDAVDMEALTVHPKLSTWFTEMPSQVSPGEVFSIGWQSVGATSLTIRNRTLDILHCDFTSGDLDEGSCDGIVAPTTPGQYNYAKYVQGPLGQVRNIHFTITVVEPAP